METDKDTRHEPHLVFGYWVSNKVTEAQESVKHAQKYILVKDLVPVSEFALIRVNIIHVKHL